MSHATLRRWIPNWARFAVRWVRSQKFRENVRHEWSRRRRGEPDPPDGLERVIVLCHGNICRSPFAGRLLALSAAGLEVRTTGLDARDGDPVQGGALRVAPRYQIDLSDHRARRLRREDVDWADWILGMEGHHVSEVVRRFPEASAKTAILGDFLPQPPFTIDDPWGQSDEVFVDAFERIARAVDRISTRITMGPA